jgi:hypothetical protein
MPAPLVLHVSSWDLPVSSKVCLFSAVPSHFLDRRVCEFVFSAFLHLFPWALHLKPSLQSLCEWGPSLGFSQLP